MISLSVHRDLLNDDYVFWRRFLKSTDNWCIDRVDNYQLSSLKKIVRHAYTNTRGYKSLYKSKGLFPDDIKNINDFRKLPFVNKEDIRDCLDKFSVNSLKGDYVTTGGSTGVPFGFYRDRKSFPYELASKAHQYSRVGWYEGCRQMVFRGIPIDTPDHTEFFPEYNELRCSSYYLTDEQMEIYRRKAYEFGPEFIKCYPSSIYIFASYLKNRNKSFPKIGGILCASENLYDFQVKLIREVFDCRVFSHYGHYELAVLAGYCEYRDSYHVLPYYGFAELLDNNDQVIKTPGQIGEIVGTSFIMGATPFVRYRTRDYAVFEGFGCKSCGRPYQLWSRIEGRLQEFIVTKSLRYVSMTAMNMHNDVFDLIRQFQYYQDKIGEVVFNYVPKVKLTSKQKHIIESQLMLKLDHDVNLVLREVKSISTTGRGKHRFLIQNLNVNFNDK